MAFQVCNGAMCICTMGTNPGTLKVTSLPGNNRTMIDGVPAANVRDKNFEPIPGTFGMCSSPKNPTVQMAKSPQPCVPYIKNKDKWMPGSPSVIIDGYPALNNLSTIKCKYAGEIIITNPGQTSVQIP